MKWVLIVSISQMHGRGVDAQRRALVLRQEWTSRTVAPGTIHSRQRRRRGGGARRRQKHRPAPLGNTFASREHRQEHRPWRASKKSTRMDEAAAGVVAVAVAVAGGSAAGAVAGGGTSGS